MYCPGCVSLAFLLRTQTAVTGERLLVLQRSEHACTNYGHDHKCRSGPVTANRDLTVSQDDEHTLLWCCELSSAANSYAKVLLQCKNGLYSCSSAACGSLDAVVHPPPAGKLVSWRAV